MCNGQQNEPRFTRQQVAEAFGLNSTEMTRGELGAYSAQLEERQAAAVQATAPVKAVTTGLIGALRPKG